MLIKSQYDISFSDDKTSVVFIMEHKRKPSIELGEIIRLLVIVKLILSILHLLR